MESPLKHFGELQDPRLPRTRRPLLTDIVLIAIAAILSGAEGWDDMERYGKAKRDWLKSFLALPFGIPSHDTFNRVSKSLFTIYGRVVAGVSAQLYAFASGGR
jgi:hypothetical protein